VPEPAIGRVDTVESSDVALGRASTARVPTPAATELAIARASTAEQAKLARGSTSEWTPATDEPPPITVGRTPAVPDVTPKQPRASTVPPESTRARSNTDRGAPVPDKAPAPPVPPLSGGRASSPRLPRAASPPIEGRGLIVPATEQEDALADLDRALSEITDERPPISRQDAVGEDDEPEIVVTRTRTEPGAKATPRRTQPGLGSGGIERAPGAPTRAKPVRNLNQSEPEIQIEELVEMIADEPDETEAATDNAVGADSVVKDSSPKITMTKDDSDAEIVVEMVAAESGPHNAGARAKRQTDAPD
jgi:hypothetical protein